MGDFLSPDQAARLSAPDGTTLPAHTIRRLARAGQIPSAVRIVDRWQLEAGAYKSWLADYVEAESAS